MSDRLTIEAAIRAVPGSNTKRGFINPKTGRVIIADKAKGKAAYTAVLRVLAQQAAEAAGWEPTKAPVMLVIDFYFTRPAGHFGTGKNAGTVKASAPKHVTVKPDLTNILKSTEDALKGIAWHDDSQVVGMQLAKVYGEKDAVRIQIAALEG